MLQLKAVEQQHEQIGGSNRNAALASLREKEAAMQSSAVQLFNRKLQLMKENNSMEVSTAAAGICPAVSFFVKDAVCFVKDAVCFVLKCCSKIYQWHAMQQS